jgi:hypothetical protein
LTGTNEPTRSTTPAKPEGWYHGKDSRGKFIHFFRGECGKPICGGRAKNHKRASYPLPDGSEFEVCPDCQWWYQNLHKPKERNEEPARV